MISKPEVLLQIKVFNTEQKWGNGRSREEKKENLKEDPQTTKGKNWYMVVDEN